MPSSSENAVEILVKTRRQFLLSAGSAAAFLSFAGLSSPVKAEGAPPTSLERTSQFGDIYAKLTSGVVPVEGKINFELPEIAENGNFVPVTITVESPMTAEDHVKAIHLLSTSNPVAHVATFRLSPANAIARIQSRMRLAKTQDVIALAEMSDGTLAISTLLVKVTIGGCQG